MSSAGLAPLQTCVSYVASRCPEGGVESEEWSQGAALDPDPGRWRLIWKYRSSHGRISVSWLYEANYFLTLCVFGWMDGIDIMSPTQVVSWCPTILSFLWSFKSFLTPFPGVFWTKAVGFLHLRAVLICHQTRQTRTENCIFSMLEEV